MYGTVAKRNRSSAPSLPSDQMKVAQFYNTISEFLRASKLQPIKNWRKVHSCSIFFLKNNSCILQCVDIIYLIGYSDPPPLVSGRSCSQVYQEWSSDRRERRHKLYSPCVISSSWYRTIYVFRSYCS
jgi:hypothetical protein